ncbi:MAG: hypothetical protein K8S99_06700 [Planctomycetes bacterium]|nr:hypothetical protein [Planctomycetota bacterium]
MKNRKKTSLSAWRELEALRPTTAEELHTFLRVFLGLDVPRGTVAEGSCAPFEYLVHAFFEGRGGEEKKDAKPRAAGEEESGDCVVWANRGGGKTHLGAAATLLDLLFKPGIQVRILGGSMEQSSRMYAHLRRMVEREGLRRLLAGDPTQRRIELSNGSVAEVLAQSQRSVRGTRVHKLRCDEVEEFDEEVWRAAQMVTGSGECGGVRVRGSVEVLSTMHRPFGLMSRLVARPGAKVFRWCALDVIQRCPPERACDECDLWEDCGGRAKTADGFVPVEDLVAARNRSSEEAWESEMMCRRPRVDASVYPTFRVERHVKSGDAKPREAGEEVIAGMDFGMRSPLVMLWAVVRGGGAVEERVVEVIGEYVESGVTLGEHLAKVESLGHPRPAWIGVDPAGNQRNAQTGMSDVQVLRRGGYAVRVRPASIREGVDRVRRRLDHGLLVIGERCPRLIEALTTYHFDLRRREREEPVKDGPDHLCDALRYMIVSLDRGVSRAESRGYL